MLQSLALNFKKIVMSGKIAPLSGCQSIVEKFNLFLLC